MGLRRLGRQGSEVNIIKEGAAHSPAQRIWGGFFYFCGWRKFVSLNLGEFVHQISFIAENFKRQFRVYDHFVEWISELGYHIELTGDEFELYVAPEKAA